MAKSGAGPEIVDKVSTTKDDDVELSNPIMSTDLLEAFTAEKASDGMVAGRKPTEQCDGMVAGRKPTCDTTEQCDGMVAGRKPTRDSAKEVEQELNNQVQKMVAERISLQENIQALQSAMANLETDKQEGEHWILLLQKALDRVEKEKMNLEEEARESVMERTSLECSLKKVAKENSELLMNVQILQAQLVQQAQSDGMVEGRKPTRDSAKRLEVEQELNNQVQKMVAKRISLQENIQALQSAMANLGTDKREGEHEILRLQKALDRVEKEKMNLEEEARKSVMERTSLECSLKKVAKENSELVMNVRILQAQLVQQAQSSGLSNRFLLVATIYFGTTQTDCAIHRRHKYQTDPLEVHLITLPGGIISPTCILFDPKKRFSKFGQEAEDEYMSLASEKLKDQDHRKWFFFRRFTMTLFNKKGQYMLKDESGKEMPALDVFSAAIAYLTNSILKILTVYENSEIRWVLTVPVVCKQFMREAANKAGIRNDHLLIALESEAASMHCHHLSVDKINTNMYRYTFKLMPCSKYMVIVANDWTVDITVHTVQECGYLRLLYAVTVKELGMDQAYRNLLASIVGKNVMDHWIINNNDNYYDSLQIFKRKMQRKETLIDRMPIRMHFPKQLLQENAKQELKNIATVSQRQGNIRVIGDMFELDAAAANSFFDDFCQSIKDQVEAVLCSRKIEAVSTILMVGGVFKSQVLQVLLKDTFRVMIVILDDANYAVLKGAVTLGLNPTVIEEGYCRKT